VTYRRFLFAALPLIGAVGFTLHVTALAALAVGGVWLLVCAFGLARISRRGLAAHRELEPSAFEDDAVAVTVVLANRGRRAAHLVEIADAFGPGLAARQRLLEPGPLRGQRRRRLTYKTFCSRTWGLYGVGPLVLRVADPMGLFPVRRAFPDIAPFAVFPRLYAVAEAARVGARPTPSPQPTTIGRPGQSLDTLGVRDYRPGDGLRHVHWPATARRGVLTVKEHEVDLVPYFTLFLDLERSHRAGTGLKSTLEYVVRTAASLFGSAIQRGDTVQAFGEGRTPLFVPPGRGELHLAHGLYELLRVRQEGSLTLPDLVDREASHLPVRSTAAMVFGTITFPNAGLDELLTALRAREVLPLLVFIDDSSFLPIDRWALPREEAEARARELTAWMEGQGVPGVVLGADEDLEQSLIRPGLFGEPA
jgi:uncharacterized protein (DUF58 family)